MKIVTASGQPVRVGKYEVGSVPIHVPADDMHLFAVDGVLIATYKEVAASPVESLPLTEPAAEPAAEATESFGSRRR